MSRMDEYRVLIETVMNEFLKESDQPYNVLIQAMRYSAMNAGKRIRPILTLEFCRIHGGMVQDALPFAAALEMIHCYSLIHDDLPCMDDDDLRRGKPSCHKQFDEATALLAGDALLTKAFQVASESSLADKDPKAVIACIQALSKFAGVDGMIGGQVLDLSMEGKSLEVTSEALSQMHELKTGALIEAACTMGTLAAGKTGEAVALAAEYGRNLGLAFQLVDDILDVTGSEALLGKPIGSDEEQEKTTFITLFGLDKTKKLAEEYTKRALEIADSYEDCDFLHQLTEQLLSRDH